MKYILISPARNEEANIDKTLKSVVSQTVLPVRWIIVSDGSTDRTDEIVKQYLEKNPWIELIRMPEHKDRQFAAKVHGFNAGYEKVKDIEYDIIGNLDADVSFDKDYFDFLLDKFMKMPDLGVGGTPFVEDSVQTYDYRFTNIEHVSGACQLFRRECFEEIGGYVPVKGGGIDWIAVTTARMKGWKTRTFTEKTLFHHRKMGTGKGNILKARYRLGKEDYYIGNHPLWEIARGFYQMKSKPYILSGVLLLFGYFTSCLMRNKKISSPDLIKFVRNEQMKRLNDKFGSFVTRLKGARN